MGRPPTRIQTGRAVPYNPPLYGTVVPPSRGTGTVQAVPNQIAVTDPGDYFAGTIQAASFGVPGINNNVPDSTVWFVAPTTYNCLEIDYQYQSVDQGWVVPEQNIVKLWYHPPYAVVGAFPPTVNPSLGTSAFGGVPFGYTPDMFINPDVTFQPPMLRGTPTLGLFLTPISLTLPQRLSVQCLGMKLFRFVSLGIWVYRKADGSPHDAVAAQYMPNITFRCWYDPKYPSLVTGQ